MEAANLSDILRSENQEDFVEYFIFPTNISSVIKPCKDTNHCNNKIEDLGENGLNFESGPRIIDETILKPADEQETNQSVQFNELFLMINATVLNIIGDYLWQKEPFILRKVTTVAGHSKDEQNVVIPYFHGLSRYGENVEDEWFIVYILLKLTEQFPDIIIRVADNDGEFLLIEAAQFLPDWAESDATCLQRVYIYRGKIHIIPIPKAAPNVPAQLLPRLPCGPPTINEVIKIITRFAEATLASEAIQKTILDRITSFPEKIQSNFQHTNIMLPPKLATILKLRPDLVSYAVQAFYYRDPIELKTARFMKNFKPGDSLVKSRVRLTKTMYAMLCKQDYRPDPKTGWGFPRPTSSEFKGHSLGAKLTTGFEILLLRANPNCTRLASHKQNNIHVSDENSKTWLRYNEKLKALGYYKEYLEFSKPYTELEEKAQKFFVKNHEVSCGIDKSNCKGDIGDLSCCSSENMLMEDWAVHELQQLVREITNVDFESLKKESYLLPPDDDDSWVEVNPDDFESILEAQFQIKSGEQNINEIPSKLKQFMSQKSNVEGVEMSTSIRNNGLDKVDTYLDPIEDDQSKNEAIDFRADDFVDAMDKLLSDLHKKESEWHSSENDSFSDEEEYLNFEEIKKKYPFSKNSKIHRLMRRMDEELSRTEVGRTFDSDSPSTSAAASAAMNRGAAAVIASTSSSNTATPIDEDPKELDEFDDIEAFDPVPVDLYTLKNMLESFRSQDTPFGPSSNLLSGVGYDITKAKK